MCPHASFKAEPEPRHVWEQACDVTAHVLTVGWVPVSAVDVYELRLLVPLGVS